MALQDIPGNSRIKEILARALVRGRVPNSLLFCGPAGVGKRRMALELAKALNCREARGDACGRCDSCRAIEAGTLPDVMEIAPEKSVITIEQVRGLKEVAYLRPMTARTRVFIVDKADKMKPEASNALLKVLEEPPLFSHILLVTANPSLLLTTIRSRCQTLSFIPLSAAEVETALCAEGCDADRARILSLLAQGSLGRALEADRDDVLAKRRAAWDLFRALVTRSGAPAFLRIFAFQRKNDVKDAFSETLEFFASFARDSLLAAEGGEAGLLINQDFESEVRECSSILGTERAVRLAEAIEAARGGLDRSLNMGLLATSFYSQTTG
jgi:DNA polymerase-3 subunit delta'